MCKQQAVGDVTTRICMGAPRKKEQRAERQRSFTEDLYRLPLYVCILAVFDSLSLLLIRTF